MEQELKGKETSMVTSGGRWRRWENGSAFKRFHLSDKNYLRMWESNWEVSNDEDNDRKEALQDLMIFLAMICSNKFLLKILCWFMIN